MPEPTPTPTPAPSPTPIDLALLVEIQRDNAQDEATARAGLAAFMTDSLQDERTARDAQDRADARVRTTIDALDRQTSALKAVPRADEPAFVDALLLALVSQPLDIKAMADRIGVALTVRAMLAMAGGATPVAPAAPAPATDPIKVPPQPPAPLNPPAQLPGDQADRYLAMYRKEFAAFGITTREQAQRHWVDFGRAEVIAGKRVYVA
jgi:hypothetical protein